MLITQTSSLDTKLIMLLKKGFNISNHLHLPNTVFFEGSGTYLNTEGNVCKVTKVVKPLGQAKSDWQIIRKMLSYSKKTFFLTNPLKNNNLAFNSERLFFLTNPLKNNNLAFNSERFSYFKNYLGFQHYALSKLSNLAFSLFKVVTACPQNIFKFKAKRAKIYNSQIRF